MFKFDDILEVSVLFSFTTPPESSNIALCENFQRQKIKSVLFTQ